ncbi:MAG: hypothetical protein J7574_13745 [Flavobacterium sp.]|uniref:hypothetical protein n=1 Tax=Flavobacterium sp. TaxID=239 RepID=UPI001B1BAF50|nr:hypothetical protein [Flavobacterium sp.]MBO9585220.1 hypothetical protein [Flavobacterium sp.]
MKTLLKSLLLFFLIITYGCENNKLCTTPPAGFSFELVDKTTGENLFTNGTYNSKDIIVKNLDDSSAKVEFKLISENNYNVLTFSSIGWKTETINYSVNIGEKKIFEFYVKAKRITKDCSHTEYDGFEIKNASYQFNQNTGIYKILIDTSI